MHFLSESYHGTSPFMVLGFTEAYHGRSPFMVLRFKRESICVAACTSECSLTNMWLDVEVSICSRDDLVPVVGELAHLRI